MADRGLARHDPITVCAKDLSYWIVTNRKHQTKKQIIKDVDLIVRPGQLLAIMGPSGSGKTTLINLIAGRVTGGERKGDVYFNGQANPSNRQKFVSYVMQSDCLLDFLTVEETLRLNAALKLKKCSKYERNDRVERVINELGLDRCRRTLVGGSASKGISGGEKKRVSIAIELLDDPALLCLDEPTSGLDAALAYDMLKLLVQLARAGRTIICTVHQPRSQVFALFDQLLLLSRGSVVYQGPAVKADEWFEQLGYPCPAHFNPADFLLDLLTESRSSNNSNTHTTSTPRTSTPKDAFSSVAPDAVTDRTDDTEKGTALAIINKEKEEQAVNGRFSVSSSTIDTFPSLFAASPMAQTIAANIKHNLDKQKSQTLPCARSSGLMQARNWLADGVASFAREAGILTQRMVLNSIRNPMKTFADIMQNCFLGFVLGAVFWQLGDESFSDAQNRAGAFFFVAINFAFGTLSVLTTFPPERALLNRDTANGIHGVLSYFVAKDVGELLFTHFPPTLFCCIFYWMCGMRPDFVSFLLFVLVSNLCIFAAFGVTLLIGAATPSADIGTIITDLTLIVFILNGGFFLKDADIPPWVGWIKWISFIRYTFMGYMLVEFEGDDSRFQEGIGGGEGVLEFYGLQHETFAATCLTLFGLGIGFRVLAFFCLKHLNRKQGLEL